MAATRVNSSSTVERKLEKDSFAGIALGVVALLACELPVAFTLLGLGTLAARAGALKPPFWIEVVAFASAVVGLIMLTGFIFQRWRRRNEQGVE